MLPTPGTCLAIILGCLVVYGLWSANRKKWTIKIAVNRDGVVKYQGLPKGRAAGILAFFTEDLDLDTKLVVFAVRHPGGRLQTKFRGSIDPGTRQRIQNYLISAL